MAVGKATPSLANTSIGGAALTPDRVAHIPPLLRPHGSNEHSLVLGLKQTAEYLGISKAHLSNVINHKVAGVPSLRCAKIGRRILIKREWADEWLELAGQESAQEW
jgi:hypothetical protein